MEFALLHLLFVMNAFDLTIENPISGYRFDVNPVERCPMNATEFETAARKRNCTGDNRYLCAPDRTLSNLIEFCTDTKISLFEKGNCLRLEGGGDLNHYNCVERFDSGCPTKPYLDNAIYEYPACLELNLDLNCFVADKNCQKRLLTTTETYDGSYKLQIIIVIVYGFLYVAILTGTVAFYIYKKGKYLDDEEYKNKRKGEDEKKLRDFLRRKEITVRHARGIIVGCGGAGKTTLLKRLANANYNVLKKIKPTRYVDVHVNKFVLTKEGKMISREERDKDPSTIKIHADVINDGDINQSIETDIKKSDVSIKTGNSKDFSSIIKNTKQKGLGKYNENRARSEHNDILQNHSKQENKKLQPSSVEKNETNKENNDRGMEGDEHETFAVSDIMDYIEAMSGTDYLGPQITFLDFAGQRMYYSYHQIYLSPGTFYILVVDMTKKLDETVEDPETFEKGCTRFESWTYEDYYKFWLQSINSFSDESTPVIVVGTHADKMDETVIKKFFAEFFGLIPDCKYPELYQHLHKDRKFAIGFPKKGVKMEDLKDLKKCIAELVNSDKLSNESVSPVWAIFEQYLLKVKERKKIITRGKLLAYNETLPEENRIHDDEITKLLKFLNKAGTVLFFEEQRLKETIILDFQWFLDAFKCIINYEVDLDAPSDNKRERFRLTGELEDEELNAIWKKCPNGEDYFKNKDNIIAYMEQLGLLAKCYSSRPYCNETPWYFVPSMRKGKFDKTSIKMYTGSTILCFEFEKKQLPMHVFYGVLFQCFKIPDWSILTLKPGKQLCLYENMAGFLVQDIVVLICVCKNQIQVQTYRKKDTDIPILLNTEIQNEVSKIIKGFEKYPSSVGYKCDNGVFNDENDLSFFSKESLSASHITCKACENWHDVDMSVCWISDQIEKEKKTLAKCTDTKTSNTSDVRLPLKEIPASQTYAREATAKSMTLLRPTTGQLIYKIIHRQTDVLDSSTYTVRKEVSKSVGLIHIDEKPTATGFRVGEKYIATCAHVIKDVISVFPNSIDCKRINIEFERKKYNKKEDPLQIFNFVQTIAYLDIDVDFAVLELVSHYADVPFPPALTCFGDVCDMEIHFVGHPGGRQMKEDSDVFPRWSPNHDDEIIPYINKLAEWSKSYFPKVNDEVVDYYSILLEPPRKILFHTSFDVGSSGSPGVIIWNDMPCVVVMLSGGTPSCYYEGLFPDRPVDLHKKVEYGYAMRNILERMESSGNQQALKLAEEIFEKWM